MWKFVVYWVIVTIHPIECDCNKPFIDEFGRTIQHSYALYCTKTETEYKHKDFVSRKEAFDFYRKAKSEKPQFITLTGGIDSVTIDSTLLR